MASKDNPTKAVLGWVTGIGSVALILLIFAILFGNLAGNVGFGNDAKTLSVINETGAYLNQTGYTLGSVNSSTSNYVITAVWNLTGPLIASGNYSISSVGVLSNVTTTTWGNVNVSYTYSYSYPSTGLTNTNNIISNSTKSFTNTAAQFPVVGTILGVAVLLLILLAVAVWAIKKFQNMGSGGNSTFG